LKKVWERLRRVGLTLPTAGRIRHPISRRYAHPVRDGDADKDGAPGFAAKRAFGDKSERGAPLEI
jgi:hypothetical protein